ncbi:alpha/beta hydrolase [Lentzea nigeriaca]|uniref:alpha/beta hydrolase n=1 Tax=Lentzea nigeriaca TaxID=1128665 RepID=UPI001958CB43|nr:alpha/beta hydrolase [Lentzea nigeriaca]MBM7857247.1 alpha-beta hydrolase superfamily lysophospholipase [Lentzea nigeriaca]
MFTFDSEDGVRIHVHEWKPDTSPRAIVQIGHGMGEHAGRYAPLAETLTDHGFAVYAGDHRGHGLSRHAEPGHLGHDGWNRLVADLVTLSESIRERHPGVPLVLLGHSLGSFAAQHYVLNHAHLVDALVLAGTTAVDQMLAAQAQVAAEGGDPLLALNQAFHPARTPFDWLSRDDQAVDAYLADPLCGFSLDAQGMADIGAASASLAQPGGIPAGLPVYVLVGDHDPLNAGLSLSDLLVERYRAAGLRDITYRTYPGARHELFNETNAHEVVTDLLTWLSRALPAR